MDSDHTKSTLATQTLPLNELNTGDMLRKHIGFTAHDTAEEFTFIPYSGMTS